MKFFEAATGIRSRPSRWGRALAAASLGATTLLAACATGGGVATGGGGEATAGLGDPAPDLAVDGFWDRKPIHLSGYRGKVVLVDLWASWCVPCKDELPALDAMASRLRGRGIEVLAISVDEDRHAAEAFLKTRKKWSLTFAHDPKGAVPDRLNPPKMPTSYIIDAAGIVRHINAGYQPGDAERLEARLVDLAH